MLALIAADLLPVGVALLIGLATGWWIWAQKPAVQPARSSAPAERETSGDAAPEAALHAASGEPATSPPEAPSPEAIPLPVAPDGAAEAAAASLAASSAVAAPSAPLASQASDPAPLDAASPEPVSAAPAPDLAPTPEPQPPATLESIAMGVKPQIVQAVGAPDDLELIHGVGPVLSALCHRLGVRRFDQIAAWTAADIAEVDRFLLGFHGRIARDRWVEQAKLLAAGDHDGLADLVAKINEAARGG